MKSCRTFKKPKIVSKINQFVNKAAKILADSVVSEKMGLQITGAIRNRKQLQPLIQKLLDDNEVHGVDLTRAIENAVSQEIQTICTDPQFQGRSALGKHAMIALQADATIKKFFVG